VRDWVQLYKKVRLVLGSGSVVRVDHPDPAVMVSGVVSQDRSEAYFVVATVASTTTQRPAPVRLPGLLADRHYRVVPVSPAGDQHVVDLGTTWLSGPGPVLPGRVLGAVGLSLPVLAPESAHVLHVRDESTA
jgi:alpha-galactosidase